jgi:hypothetical protein
MFELAKRSLIAALVVAAMAIPSVVCATAYARLNLDTQAPAVSVQESGTDIPQVGGVQASSDGFDWTDAGIGAASAVVLIGACAAMAIGRRRQGSHAATS